MLQQLKQEVTFHTCRGQAVLLSEWWNRFQELCNESIPFYYKSRRAFFKYKITQIIPDITIIPRQGTDLEDDLLISSSLSLAKICELVNGNSDVAEEMKLPAYNQNEMGQMVHVAFYLRSLILAHPPNEKAELTEETAYASVPEALYIFMALKYGD